MGMYEESQASLEIDRMRRLIAEADEKPPATYQYNIPRPPAPPPPPPQSVATVKRKRKVCDTECYSNLWSIGFIHEDEPNVEHIYAMCDNPATVLNILHELRAERGATNAQHFHIAFTLDDFREAIIRHLHDATCVTFNGIHYDMQMIAYALAGATRPMLKKLNDHIIVGGLKHWEFYDLYGVPRLDSIDHIDLMEMSPAVKTGLKKYAGREHAESMQELPFDPAKTLTDIEIAELLFYMGNDCRNTLRHMHKVQDRIELREEMNERFKDYWRVDFRSKSDAQMAELAFKAILNQRRRERGEPNIERSFWKHGTTFRYIPPPYISFKTQQLQDVLACIMASEFIVSDKDQCEELVDANEEKIKTGVIMPKVIKDLRVEIGNTKYKLGIGGIHSTESSCYFVSKPGVNQLRILDVTSYYPFLILNCGIFPRSCGPEWTQEYRNFLNERVAAKAEVRRIVKEIEAAGAYTDIFERDDIIAKLKQELKRAKTKEGGFKIFLNGSFGKLGSKYSILYTPDGLIRVTITGQLSLLMLIESLELHGIPVISANTDGIVVDCPATMTWLCDALVREWEATTGLTMECDEWRALFARDVNNYVGFEMDMSTKRKGAFGEPTLTKDPAFAICATAVVAHLKECVVPYLLGQSVTNDQLNTLVRTITECKDITQFVAVRNVKGGAQKNGNYLGKVVRWAYAKGEAGAIHYATNGNRVPKSEGARPLMQLPREFPDWIDHAWYVREATVMLGELGLKN